MSFSESKGYGRRRAVIALAVGAVAVLGLSAITSAQGPDDRRGRGPAEDVGIQNATVEFGQLRDVSVAQSRLTNLTGIDVNVRDTILADVNLTGATVRGSLVRGGILEDTTVQETRTQGAEFRNATLQDVTVCRDAGDQQDGQDQQNGLFNGVVQDQQEQDQLNESRNRTEQGAFTFEDFLLGANETLSQSNVTEDEVQCILLSMDRDGEPRVQAFLLEDTTQNAQLGGSFEVEVLAPDAQSLNVAASLLGPLAEVEEADENVTDGNLTNGDLANGNVTNGNVTNGNVTNGNVTNGNVTEVTTASDLIESVEVFTDNETLGTFNATEDIPLEDADRIRVRINLTQQDAVDQLFRDQEPVEQGLLMIGLRLDGAPLLLSPIEIGPSGAAGVQTGAGQGLFGQPQQTVTTTTTTA